MGHLVSSWYNSRPLPESYIVPPEQRPGNFIAPRAGNIPVIDLRGHDQTDIIRQILEASKQFGIFQVPTSFLSIILSDNDLFLPDAWHQTWSQYEPFLANIFIFYKLCVMLCFIPPNR